ncbi:response regulator transcription factor [Clostridium sp. D2Q-14]|uniref:response regulator transcription factor n=1 Tax=Anaeromonas gelatinilytica TaxID=2683194 RepID=UPI00193B77DC|nr:response regulator transcription factor [Anaeromonas gelatinilytica]MBS4534457.1 response regulator transcription factor [Anaeromonas gelatinilytica]
MNTILLLEDEESVNRGIAFTLEKEGYQVIPCTTIEQASKNFERNEIQLIICDITLPDGNGLNLIRMIRRKSNVHIICLTALDQEIDQVMGYEAGADDYIAKPFSLSVLSLKINAFFKKQLTTDSGITESGDIRLSFHEMQIWKCGEEISLTKNEWKLLQAFIGHPKQIMSKRQLLEQLYDMEGDFVEENTIAVNILRLREKIEGDPTNPQYIKNIRGIGYIWDKECVKK